ncbi:helix-turn-helix domain-containing protein [Salinigranum marinum]|uniref:helix-turn-helix domain-containing protein n=1 Tax=Salinigranum marinum TaxID=1515595 RepID=UPI002989C9CE|nr:helix-turn-helix domain-containing protein [Salinigranum marinum]
MSVIATLDVAAEHFVLEAAISEPSGLRVQLERVVPSDEWFVPYFWVADGSVDAIETALRSAPDIDSFRVLDRINGEALLRANWSTDASPLVETIHATSGELLDAVGTAGEWRVHLRFPDHTDLTEFYRRCHERGIRLDFKQLHNPGVPTASGLGAGLTETQRETLLTALERGYFDVPREINLVELAAELGVSDTAVSQRLRRGISGLLVAAIEGTESADGPSAE